jgi:hypothetical protein
MSSLGELFRDKRTMVKRPAKAHLFFLNVGRPSTEFQTFEHIPLRLIHVEPGEDESSRRDHARPSSSGWRVDARLGARRRS